MILYYVDTPCGGAKTYAAVRYAHRLARLGKTVLFVQPSIFLINQTLAELASRMPEIDPVIADIIDHIRL